jgi:hypothetical protein
MFFQTFSMKAKYLSFLNLRRFWVLWNNWKTEKITFLRDDLQPKMTSLWRKSEISFVELSWRSLSLPKLSHKPAWKDFYFPNGLSFYFCFARKLLSIFYVFVWDLTKSRCRGKSQLLLFPTKTIFGLIIWWFL